MVFLAGIALSLGLGLVAVAQPATATPRVSRRVVVIDFPTDTVQVVLQKKRAGHWVKARSRRLSPGPTVGGYNTLRVTIKVRPGEVPGEGPQRRR